MDGVKALVSSAVSWALSLRLVRAYLRYSELRGPGLADSVTYRTLFSVFAGLLLLFSAAALWLGGNPDALRALSVAVESFVPGLSDLVDPERIKAPAGFTIVGVVSLIGLLGAAISAIASLRIALRTLADELHDDGFFFWVLLRNLLVAVCFGGLLALAATLSIATSVGLSTVAGWLGLSTSDALLKTAARVLGIVVVLAIDTVAIAMIFRLLSGVRAPARALWGGALLGGVGLTVLQELSGLFVRGASSNPLLASFASLIALLIWFNLSAQVILIACTTIIVGAVEERDPVRERHGAGTLQTYRRLRAEDRVRAATAELRAAQEAELEQLRKTSGLDGER